MTSLRDLLCEQCRRSLAPGGTVVCRHHGVTVTESSTGYRARFHHDKEPTGTIEGMKLREAE